MTDPQVIIRLTSAGNLQVEAPGFNGSARTKVEGITLDALPPEIQSALIAQRDRLRAQPPAQLAPTAANARSPREDQLEAARRIGVERLKRHYAWIETLPRERQELEREKLRKIAELQRERETARAHKIYQYTAQHHSVALANRVIDNPKLRPRKARQNASATKRSVPDISKLREGVDYKVYAW